MKKLEDLYIADKWLKEDLEDLIEDEYANLLELTSQQMENLSQELYREAERYYDISLRLERQAEIIKRLSYIIM